MRGRERLIAVGVGGFGVGLLLLVFWEASLRVGWTTWNRPELEERSGAISNLVKVPMPSPHHLLVGLRSRPPLGWLGMDITVGRVYDYYKTNPWIGGSCAVVGSSGNLTGWGQGNSIDAHDQVIRMNFAPTSGYEPDVGSRTSVMLLNSKFVRILEDPPGTHADYMSDREVPRGSHFLFTHPLDYLGVLGRLEQGKALGMSVSIDRTWFFSPQIYEVLKLVDTNLGISAGLRGAILMALLCEEVSLYGFGSDPKGRWDYYYKPATVDHHDADGEARFIANLSRLRFVTYFPGNVQRQKIAVQEEGEVAQLGGEERF